MAMTHVLQQLVSQPKYENSLLSLRVGKSSKFCFECGVIVVVWRAGSKSARGRVRPAGLGFDTSNLSSLLSSQIIDSVFIFSANPRVNVELRQRLPPPATQQPSNSTQQPSNSTQQLSNSTQQPSNSTQQPSNSTQQPSNLTQQPSNSTQQPSNSTQQPSNLTQQPSNSTQQPSNSIQQPSNSIQQPSNSTQQLSNSKQQPPCAGRMDVDASPSRSPSPWAEVCGDAPDVSGSQLVSSHQEVVFGPITASGRVETFDQDKNVSFLLKELDTLRETNKKLQEELVQKETELQRREVEEELGGERREAHHWERSEAVLGELLAAQKDRDQALMSRLLLANEERDEALLRARQLQQAAELESFPLEDVDMDVSELLQRVCGADSVRDVQRVGSVLVQRLRSALQRRSDITAQEMKAVMEERDGSIAKLMMTQQFLQDVCDVLLLTRL
ncbi:uncharacterized protein LOC116043239 [Sander lucioperca]|uniref:uncharacterized protein LOC116043239 n=1 Tax=Sander lucioperca TaxID=283035 RepID=UPI0016537807|nr:uncharacterized protein LOC116043239 [Sander lucioperca]